MISWRARDAYWIPDPLESGDIDRELNSRIRHGNWGVSLEVQQSTESEPRRYAWEYTSGDRRLHETGYPLTEQQMFNHCAPSDAHLSWGFTFVRIDP